MPSRDEGVRPGGERHGFYQQNQCSPTPDKYKLWWFSKTLTSLDPIHASPPNMASGVGWDKEKVEWSGRDLLKNESFTDDLFF